mgnify:CR=1 FL=1
MPTQALAPALAPSECSSNLARFDAVRYGLRVGVKGGGCSGMSYVLGFDRQRDHDRVFG